MDSVIRRALDVNWRNLALGHRMFRAEGATFVVNPAFPSIHDANFIYDVTVTTDAAMDLLLARARREYAHAETLTFRLGPDIASSVTRRLDAIGRERQRTLVMLLDGESVGAPRPHDIRPIAGDAEWAALAAMKRADWREHAARQGEDPERLEIPDGLAATNRMKRPPVRYFLAFADGQAIGHCNAWSGIEGVGQVEDLYVEPAYRHRGIATALLHRCVADARANGAGPIVICADLSDTPHQMYAALGWRPIATCRQYGVAVR